MLYSFNTHLPWFTYWKSPPFWYWVCSKKKKYIKALIKTRFILFLSRVEQFFVVFVNHITRLRICSIVQSQSYSIRAEENCERESGQMPVCFSSFIQIIVSIWKTLALSFSTNADKKPLWWRGSPGPQTNQVNQCQHHEI